MILKIAALIIGGIALLIPLGETWYERDWPRDTWFSCGCIIALSLFVLSL